MKSDLFCFPARTERRLPAATAALAALALAAPSVALTEEAPAPSRVHALLNFEFSDKYLTPRGMIVQNQGLVFQQLALGFFNLYKDDAFINDVTLVGGVWNCFGTDRLPSSDSNGADNTSWYEIDPIAGFSFGFAKNFTLDVTYTSFNMQILNIPFSHHLETKLSFNDSPYLKAFALHPYVLYWRELDGKATAAQVPFFALPGPQPGPGSLPHSSWYFDIGVAPSYTFKDVGLKLEAPCRVLLPDSEFYGEYYDEASFVGLYELGVKATVPLNFMPKGYGNWSFHAGFKYMGFVDENLQRMQQFNATSHSESHSTLLYCGLSTFF